MRKRRLDTIADLGLGATIVLAPALGGSSRASVLPILIGLMTLSYGAMLVSHRRDGRSLHVHALVVALIGLALASLAQAIALPASIIQLFSPRAIELREFVSGVAQTSAPVSYEPAASWREASKLALYALVATVAYERARARPGPLLVGLPVMVAGITAGTIAIVHRLFDIDRFLGVMETMRPTSEMYTTFTNPNHSAGFMTFACLIALGLAISDTARHRQLGYIILAVVFGGVSMLTLSRGGIVSLLLGLALLVVLLLRLRVEGAASRFRLSLSAVAFVALAIVGLVALWKPEEIIQEFASEKLMTESVRSKVDAMKDAWPMIVEHPFFGIGRGAYGSVYPAYQTVPVQLTYVFPENIVVQLLAEWGLLLGGMALLGILALLVLRLRDAEEPYQVAGVVAGITIVIHNLIDFSLELPGIAIPVVAVLASLTPEDSGLRLRASLKKVWGAGLAFAIPVGLSFAAYFVSAQVGDLVTDMERLAARVEWTQKHPKEPMPAALSKADPEALAIVHPANPFIAAQAAYFAEIEPDKKRALKWANRVLFLAPTYADGHLATGRLLLGFGQRKQALEVHLRKAWELSSAARRMSMVGEITSMVRSAAELHSAIPRRDKSLDVLDEAEIVRAVRELTADKRGKVAAELMSLVDLQNVAPTAEYPLAIAARSAGALDVAEKLTASLMSREPSQTRAVALYVSLLKNRGADAEARKLIHDAIEQAERPNPALLEAAIEIAIADKDVEGARALLERMRVSESEDRLAQAKLASLEAAIEDLAGRPQRVLDALDRSLKFAPEDAQLRYRRAEVLTKLGMKTRAMSDVEQLLQQNPGHRGARLLQERLREPRVKN